MAVQAFREFFFCLLSIRLMLWTTNVHEHNMKAATPAWLIFFWKVFASSLATPFCFPPPLNAVCWGTQQAPSLIFCLVHAWSGLSRERDDSALFATLYLSRWEFHSSYLMWKHHVTPGTPRLGWGLADARGTAQAGSNKRGGYFEPVIGVCGYTFATKW